MWGKAPALDRDSDLFPKDLGIPSKAGALSHNSELRTHNSELTTQNLSLRAYQLRTQHSELFTQYLTVIQPITRLPIVSPSGCSLCVSFNALKAEMATSASRIARLRFLLPEFISAPEVEQVVAADL